MPIKSLNLRLFWLQLMRRRVIHVISVYASSAFIIIELINNLSEPLKLPDYLLTIVVILLAVGFPFAIILSWLFDPTSKGIERTKPISDVVLAEASAVPRAWKLATMVSFAVIIGLIVLNIVGINKQAYAASVKSLVVLPFSNYTGDNQLEYFVDGMHSSLIEGIGQMSGLRVLGETSANAYKKVNKSLPVIASEFNVDAALESTVMCLGDSFCLQVKPVNNFPEERQLWVDNLRLLPAKRHNSTAAQITIRLSWKPSIKEDFMNQLTPEGFKLGIKFYDETIEDSNEQGMLKKDYPHP